MPEEAEWGWWSVYDDIDSFKRNSGIPDPVRANPLADALESDLSPTALADLLTRFGGYVAYLEAFVGEQNARSVALGEAYAAGILVAATYLDLPKNATEKAKEAKALADNEQLRETKKLWITAQALVAISKGWKEAYIRAWETVSRRVTIHMGDVSLQTGRHP